MRSGWGEGRRRAGRNRAAEALLLVLAVLLVYARTVGFPFISFDDQARLLDNPMVTGGISPAGFTWALTTGYAANWMPLTWLSHQADFLLFGKSAGMHHLVNLLLHAATAVLLQRFLLAATGRRAAALLGALLFAVHPMHVESVAWVSSRKDVLSGFFVLVTLLGWTAYLRRPNAGRYLAAAAAFALALASKPTAVTLPLLLLLLDRWPFGRGWSLRVVAEKVPLLLMSAAVSVVTYVSQHRLGVVESVDALPLRWRLWNAVAAYGTYLRRLAWPDDLTFYYPHPRGGIDLRTVIGWGAVLAVATIGAWLLRRRFPAAGTGWLWYAGAMVPMIGLVQVSGQALADRYAYVPFIGLYLVIALAVDALPGRCRRAGLAMLAAAAVALAGTAWRQTGYWGDERAFNERALAVTEGNYIAWNNLGILAAQRGDPATAIDNFGMALMIRPDFVHAHDNMASALVGVGRAGEAMGHYMAILEVSPGDPRTHLRMGLLLAGAGAVDQAMIHFRQAAIHAAGDPGMLAQVAEAMAGLGYAAEAREVEDRHRR
jgi:tetratricopeptide (TPR) repeat protein